MTRHLWLLALLLAAGPYGCAGPPVLVPAGDASFCPAIFLQGRWQVVHAIEATYPDASRGLLVGVTQLSSSNRTLDCTLMTVEGFVLFQASDAGNLEIRRALPPFDRPGFAAGLLADVRLVLLAPAGGATSGRTADGRAVCRYACAGDQTTDIAAEPGGWRLERFDAAGRLRRTAILRTSTGNLPQHISLQAHGAAGYRLNLKLISAACLPVEVP